ncbi:MAG: ABC transporter permease [Armatimonadota bacterium]|nr:ABC transporter permease [Armatimonadota bacterium]MDR7421526.1 ABC transporter permease [Armatimonadota bacterium]MDR7456773.1 ABC transporter permease [Armatimonadota bacterium]MDR7497017.1 ABC transporter permease [Armatimonadota bacterium]MDR7510505.1 ABC transporter permease [Armatimonadota bacterium]
MRYLVENAGYVGTLLAQHLWLTAVSLAIALAVALPVGLLAARRPRVRGGVLGVLGVIYTIPSLALFVLLIPFLGLGLRPAVLALVAYAQVILVRNITVGLLGVDPAAVEAARGMGMTSWQRFARVELPLAMPVILAGVRIAVLAIIGIGTIAAFINAGGLGVLLFTGVAQGHADKIIAGAAATSGLALAANALLRRVELAATALASGEGR